MLYYEINMSSREMQTEINNTVDFV